jgi:hypothetical protein
MGAPPGASPASPQLGLRIPQATVPVPVAPKPIAAAPPATDDPQLAAARQRFQDTTSQFTGLLDQEKDLGNKIAAVPQVNRADYKPSIGRQILAIVLGTLAGAKGNTQLAADTGNSVRDLKYNRAEEARNKTLAPFLAQQNAVERQMPLLNAANESAWREYQAGMGEKKEALAEKKEGDTTQWHNDLNDIRDRIGQGNIDERDQRRLDQIEQEKDKVKNDRDRLALEQQIAQIRQQVANTGSAGEVDRASQAEINQKQRPVLSTIKIMEQRLMLDPKDTEATQELAKAHDQLTQIENDVRNRRAPAATPGAPAKANSAAPTAASGPPASLWKGKETKVLTLKDDKGNTSKWQLVKGQPQQIQGGTAK